MAWSVVNFNSDNTVEVVPDKWMNIKNGYCAWPKSLNEKDLKKAILHKIRPNNEDFTFYKARCFASNIDTFSNAQKKCEKARSQSDLFSAEDNFKRKSYKILKKQKTPSSESDYEQSDDNSNSIPRYHSDPDSSNKKLAGWSPLKTSLNRGEIDKIMSPIMVLDNPEKIPHTSTNNITASKLLIETTKSPIFEKNSYGNTSVSPTMNSSQSYESVFKIKKFAASDNSTNQIEQVIKYVLIQTPFKLKRQKESTIHTTVMEQS